MAECRFMRGIFCKSRERSRAQKYFPQHLARQQAGVRILQRWMVRRQNMLAVRKRILCAVAEDQSFAARDFSRS